MIELAANLLVAFLLVLTTSWCVLLYRRLGRLRVERSDIEAFVTAIDAAARRAEQAIAGIRETAAETQRVLDAEQQQAQQRAAELARLLESATRMARRIESAIHQGARAMAEEGLARERASERSDPAAARSAARPRRAATEAAAARRASANRCGAAEGARGAAVSTAGPAAGPFGRLSWLLVATALALLAASGRPPRYPVASWSRPPLLRRPPWSCAESGPERRRRRSSRPQVRSRSRRHTAPAARPGGPAGGEPEPALATALG